MSAPDRIHLVRTFDAPVERVFRAFVEPDEAVQWWGPADIETSVVEIDLRVGGRCRWVMHPGGGTAELFGRIVRLDPPQLLVMTNQWAGDPAETLVTLRFVALGDRTRLELTHERLPREVPPSEFTDGWDAALRSLSAYLDGTPGRPDPAVPPYRRTDHEGDIDMKETR